MRFDTTQATLEEIQLLDSLGDHAKARAKEDVLHEAFVRWAADVTMDPDVAFLGQRLVDNLRRPGRKGQRLP